MKVVRRPKFVEDVGEAYAYLADRSPRSAGRLLDEVDALVELLSAFPELGRMRPELRSGVRSFRVRRFGHILFYRGGDNAIILLRLLHPVRDIGRSDFDS